MRVEKEKEYNGQWLSKQRYHIENVHIYTHDNGKVFAMHTQ